jgi:hypothetical protein
LDKVHYIRNVFLRYDISKLPYTFTASKKGISFS